MRPRAAFLVHSLVTSSCNPSAIFAVDSAFWDDFRLERQPEHSPQRDRDEQEILRRRG
jgi:hypothetical protein